MVRQHKKKQGQARTSFREDSGALLPALSTRVWPFLCLERAMESLDKAIRGLALDAGDGEVMLFDDGTVNEQELALVILRGKDSYVVGHIGWGNDDTIEVTGKGRLWEETFKWDETVAVLHYVGTVRPAAK